MVDWSMSNNTSSTMKTVGRVSYSSNRSSKSLGLSGASVFSLVWLGDLLVGNLASWTSMIASSNNWSMGNNRSSMVSRGNMDNRGSIGWSSMDNRGSISRSSMDNRGSIGWSGMNQRSIWVDSSSFISNISNISIISIGMVVHMLGTTIRKSNRVRSGHSSCTIRSFISIECRLGVVISYSISKGVRRGLIRVGWLSSMVCRGNMSNNWSMISRSSMISWSSMISGSSMISWSSMDNWSSMISWGMDSMDTMDSMNTMDCMNSMNSMSSNRDNSSTSNSNRLVSTEGRLDLRKTFRVVYLRDGGMSSSKSL